MTMSLAQKKDAIIFTQDQLELIKNTLCRGINDDELKLFSAICQKTGLDPFMKQIYAVKRGDQMTIQTSIDGYRLIAERTGRYCPGRESTHQYKADKLVSSTSYVKKQTKDGTWHEVSVTSYLDEYKPNYKSQFWDTKPHIMLDKCAEALALRKAFPNELSGLYTSEEMDQAQNTTVKTLPLVSEYQAQELQSLLEKCSSDIQEKMNAYLKGKGINSFYQLPLECFDSIWKRLSAKSEENQVALTSSEV